MSFTGIKFRSSACIFFVMFRPLSAFAPTTATGAARACRSVSSTPSAMLTTSGSATFSQSPREMMQRGMSSGATGDESPSPPPPIRHVNKEEMKKILMEHEEMKNADLESPYFVLDVRTEGEVQQTGKLSPSVPTLPVQVMVPPYNCLQMDDQEFEDAFGFAKPSKDLTMVFSCAAGIRSITACKAAQDAGYKDCINYMGGAHEWFAS